MLVKQDPSRIGKCDISDLTSDPVVKFQHKFYLPMALLVALVFPVYVCSLWGDAWGGLFFASMGRAVFVHHATFFVNSLAHYHGSQGFSDHHTARDSIFTALLTLGEGFHNFHHEFPYDYRNALKFYQYDPTKWLIAFCGWLGLAYNLKQADNNEIKKAQWQMGQRALLSKKFAFEFGSTDHLPPMTWNKLQREVAMGSQLFVINGIVHDVAPFLDEHPGGRRLLLQQVGTDATEAYLSNPHQHSPSARKFLTTLHVARIVPESADEHHEHHS
jgi:stearoyl-CoA desaturase (delta-9 desaturase)